MDISIIDILAQWQILGETVGFDSEMASDLVSELVSETAKRMLQKIRTGRHSAKAQGINTERQAEVERENGCAVRPSDSAYNG